MRTYIYIHIHVYSLLRKTPTIRQRSRYRISKLFEVCTRMHKCIYTQIYVMRIFGFQGHVYLSLFFMCGIIFVCTYTYTCTYIHTHTHKIIQLLEYLRLSRINVCIYPCVSKLACISKHVCAQVHTLTCAHKHAFRARECMCTYVYMYTCHA